ncbi:hypothetical protein ACHAWT_001293 [Skeletonema menzelii]
MGFSDFITLGFVSPCSDPIPETVAPLIDEMAQNRLREAILQQKEWPGMVKVGSFVVMRHEYGNCQYCPDWLKR